MNSVWEDNDGHAIEGDTNGQGLFEGCVFTDVDTVVTSDYVGHLFSTTTSNADSCETYLGRACEANSFNSSGDFTQDDTSFFSNFTGLSIASATAASDAATSVPANAGYGKVTTYSTSSASKLSTSDGGNSTTGNASSGFSSPSGSSSSSGSLTGSNSTTTASGPSPSGTGSASGSKLSSSSFDSGDASKASKCKRNVQLRREAMAEGQL